MNPDLIIIIYYKFIIIEMHLAHIIAYVVVSKIAIIEITILLLGGQKKGA